MGSNRPIRLVEGTFARLYEQVSASIKQAISDGELESGDKLSSVRDLAEQLEVSVMTVRLAVQDLCEQGLLEVRKGAGTFVRGEAGAKVSSGSLRGLMGGLPAGDVLDRHSEIESRAPGAWAERMQKTFDRTLFHARYDQPVSIDFRVGAPPTEILGGKRWQEAVSRWSRSTSLSTGGSQDPQGLLELRQSVSKWLRSARGMDCSADDVFIVSGGQQARNLICRLLVNEGSRVAFEEPGSVFARLALQSYGAILQPVAVDESGLVMDALKQVGNVALAYVTPSAQFPTGAVMSANRRRQLAQWAQARGAFIVEDDNNSEFFYESRIMPAIQSMAPEHTIYFGTFSQSLAPSLRVGYMVVPEVLRAPLLRIKWLADRCTSPLMQQLLAMLFAEGLLPQHLKKAQQICEQRREALLEELSGWDAKVRYTPVKGGLHQTVWLDTSLQDLEVFDACFERGVGVLPVSNCYLKPPASPGLMLNFSALDPAQIKEGLRIVAEVINRS